MNHLVSLVVVSSVACSGSSSSSPDAATTGPSVCSAARAQLLGAVNSVSTGNVTVLSSSSGVTTLYVDASAGGISATGPWVFVSLGSKAKVSVTDTTSVSSTDWDLAFKRPVVYTNGGDGGTGQGGAVMIPKAFASVTAADTSSAAFTTEKFFDAQCNPMTDPIGAPLTTFSTWYSYDQTAHTLMPAAGTWLVRGGTGAMYKLRIDSYYANPDGSDGTGDGGTFKLDVGAL